jgi:hypothetical protein
MRIGKARRQEQTAGGKKDKEADGRSRRQEKAVRVLPASCSS